MNTALAKLKATRLTKIVVAVIVFFSCIIAWNSYHSYEETKVQFQALMVETEKRNADDCAYLLSEMLRPNRELLLSTAQQLTQQDLENDVRIRELLLIKAGGLTLVDGLFFGRTADGLHITSTSYDLPAGYDPRQRSWYLTAVRNKGFSMTEPYQDASTDKLTITFSYPIYQGNQLKGVLGLDIFLDNLKRLLNNFSANRNSSLCIFDNTGTIIYDTNNSMIGKNFTEHYVHEHERAAGKDFAQWPKRLTGNSGQVPLAAEENHFRYSCYNKIEDYGLTIISSLSAGEIEKTIQQRTALIVMQGVLQFFTLIMIALIIYINIDSINNRRLKYRLYHDSLTGLETRYALETKIEKLHQQEPRSILGMIVINVDNFSVINDTLGHIVGDQALTLVARFLQQYCDGKGSLYRLNGDEFALLLENSDEQQIENIANEVKHKFSENLFYIGNKSYDFTVSIGAVLFEADTNFDQVLYLAYSAMRMAKDEGKNKVVCLFNCLNQSFQEMTRHNKHLAMVKEAIRKKSFVLYLQPIVHLRTNAIVHYEALIRLLDDHNKLVMPMDFIPIAERYGLIAHLDKWVFDEILSLLNRYPRLKLYMNLSAVSLNDSALLAYFEKKIEEAHGKGQKVNLGIEITETATLRNAALAASWITKFKELGCEIALDDFGVGYTSFSYLKQMPLDYIKIDGSFISSVDSNPKNAVISSAINTVAVSLGYKAIAEYVENDAIIQTLIDIGVEYGQGYGLGRPGPVEQMLAGYTAQAEDRFV